MATFKFYDIKEEDSLKLCMTLSNLGDIEDQIHQLWQQLNFLLQQYCTQCKSHNSNKNRLPGMEFVNLGNNICNYLIITKLNTYKMPMFSVTSLVLGCNLCYSSI